MRLALAIAAAVSFLATMALSRVAERSRCIEAVRRVPVAGGALGEVLEKKHPGFHWVYDGGGRDGADVSFESDSRVPVYTWSCSDDPVPLVLAVNEAARALTPLRARE